MILENNAGPGKIRQSNEIKNEKERKGASDMAEKMKYCRNCGYQIEADAKFCRNCGFQVGTGQKPSNEPVQPAPGINHYGSGGAGTAKRNYGPGAAGTAKRNSGPGKIIAIIAAVAAVVIVFAVAQHLIEQKRYDAYRQESIERWEESRKEQASGTAAGGILPSLSAKAQVKDGEAPVIGSIGQNGFSLQIEEDAFPGGTVVSVEPVSQDSISEFQNPEDYQLISAPVRIECESYEGEFFDSDVVLTIPIPDGEERLDRLAFVYFDDKTGEERVLWPDSFDLENRTMSVALPHFSEYAGVTLQQKKQINEFLDEYSRQIVQQQDINRQTAEALEPYVKAHVDALGLRDDAAKDLIDSTINYLGGRFKGDEFDPNPYGNTIETGVKTGTTLMKAVLEGDLESQEEGLQDIVLGAIMHAWDEQGLTDKINKAKDEKSEDSEFKGGTAEFIVGNTNALSRMSARMVEGDWEGAAEELGGIMQGVHPAVEFTTKGTVFLARQMDLMFIEWKQGEIEELYQVYKNGAEGLFGNSVLPYNQDTNHASFLTFINTSSGFVKGKMVNRFYNLDKIREVCDKYGWDFDEYKQLAEKYRDVFEKRGQDALLEYFDTRIRQEAEQEKIREKERLCIETMLNSELGVLTSGYWSSFFGESEANPYNMRNRLDRLVRVRGILSKYVDEEELDRLARAGSFNWGDLLNNWVSLVSSYPREEALQRFLRYLQEAGVLKGGMEKLIREEVPDADIAQVEENAEEDTEKEAAKEETAKTAGGYWTLKETNLRVEEDEIGEDGYASYYYDASELTHTERVSLPDNGYHGAGSATLITNCSAPPQNIRPGEEVVMHLSTDATYGGDYMLWSVSGSVSYGAPNDERDGIMYNAGIRFEPAEEDGENSVYMDPYDNPHNPTADVVHEFGEGSEPGSEMAILFYGSGSVTLWIYEWVE